MLLQLLLLLVLAKAFLDDGGAVTVRHGRCRLRRAARLDRGLLMHEVLFYLNL